jgi:hypothetical protein
MNTYLITITYGGNYDERYVTAASAEAAIAQVRASLDARTARFANIFA